LIVAVDGHPMTFHWQFRDAIAKHPEQPMRVSICTRVTTDVTVTPGRHGTRRLLGVLPVGRHDQPEARIWPGDHAQRAENIEFSRMIFQTLVDCSRGKLAEELMARLRFAQGPASPPARLDRLDHVDGVDQPEPSAC